MQPQLISEPLGSKIPKGSQTMEGAPPIDVGRLIDEHPWTSFQTVILCLVSLAFVVDSLANNVLSVLIPAIIGDWHVKRADFSSVIAAGWAGVAFGTIVAGALADRYGRKVMLLASILVFGLATAGGALITDMHQLLLLRTLDGFGIGGAIPTAAALLADFSPSRRRSRAVIFGMICMPVGTFAGGIIASAVLPHWGWRSLFAINGALALLVSALLGLFVPESPRFLARRPDHLEALLRGLRQLKIEVPGNGKWAQGNTSKQGFSLAPLFGRATLWMTLELWGAFFFCLLASYTSLSWMPTLLASHGYSLGVSSLALSASGVGGIIASLVTARLIEIYGSRIALLLPAGLVVASAVALMLMPLDPARSVLPVLLAIATLGLSLNSLTGFVYAFGAFVYPPAARGTGLGAAGLLGRMGALTSSYSSVAVLAIGSQAYFGFIAATALLATLFLVALRTQIPNDKAFDAARS